MGRERARTAAVAAGEAAEAVLKLGLADAAAVLAAAHAPAQHLHTLGIAADDEARAVGQVGVAAVQEVGARLAKQVLRALDDEEGQHDRQEQAEPARVPLPETALPHQTARGVRAVMAGGHVADGQHGDGEDDERGGHDGDQACVGYADGVWPVGKRDGRVGERERSPVGRDEREDTAGNGESAVARCSC